MDFSVVVWLNRGLKDVRVEPEQAELGPITFKTLADFSIPYDEIFFGKPWGHFYVDDLAICPFQGETPLALAKQTGFYPTDIKAVQSIDGAGPGVVTDGKPTAAAAKAVAAGRGGSGGGSTAVSSKEDTKSISRFAIGVAVGIAATLVLQQLRKRS